MKKGFFVSPVIILFFFVIAGIVSIYFNSADSEVSRGISAESLIRKNNIQIWNMENSFASNLRIRTYELSRNSSLTNEISENLKSIFNLEYVSIINDSYPYLKIKYTSPHFVSDDGISFSEIKNKTIYVNYPFLEAVELIGKYNEEEFESQGMDYRISNNWLVKDFDTVYVYFYNENYNITNIYPFKVKRG
ncbi:MAG: hypothetical protein PHW96_01535 [Candidatus Nanoarchaeia archaeon]|nr:hypothetical protein [Candidatus Nanoarchaeia archaeon]